MAKLENNPSSKEIFKASGLIDLWYFEWIDKRLIKDEISNQPKVLTLTHLQGSRFCRFCS